MTKGSLANQLAAVIEESDAKVDVILNGGTTPGGNSKKAKVGGIAADQLTSIVERIERLQEEKKSIGEDIKDVFTEAKGNGYDNATIREMLKLRAMDKADRDEREALRDTYAHALGVFG